LHNALSATLVCSLWACGIPRVVTHALAAERRATRATATVREAACEQDCVSILRAGLRWLVDLRSHAPAEIVLDTTRSGVQFSGAGPGVRVVPLPTLGRLAEEAGISLGDGEELVECRVQASSRRTCALRRGEILATIQPPRPGADRSNHASLMISVDFSTGESRWQHLTYRLTLHEVAGLWRVADARIVERS
jgi:hypothetical protein